MGIKRQKIIKDPKLRGEWAESVFMEHATEHGLAVSKPWGEMNSYDFVVGKSGRFVSVQVKSTTAELEDGYICTVRGAHKAYRAGSFDFLAAYVVPADAWYIIPAELIRGKESLTLYPNSKKAKYEKYREAWHLLKEAAGSCADRASQEAGNPDEENDRAGAAAGNEAGPRPGGIGESRGTEPRFPTNALERMQAAFKFARRRMEGNDPRPQKEEN